MPHLKFASTNFFIHTSFSPSSRENIIRDHQWLCIPLDIFHFRLYSSQSNMTNINPFLDGKEQTQKRELNSEQYKNSEVLVPEKDSFWSHAAVRYLTDSGLYLIRTFTLLSCTVFVLEGTRTSDIFPLHTNVRVIVQTPHPGIRSLRTRFFGCLWNWTWIDSK